MTPLSLLLSLFPAFVLLGAIAAFIALCLANTLLQATIAIGSLLFCLYGFPVLTYRLHEWRYPIVDGIYYLMGNDYNPWWGSHQIQTIYIVLPVLEKILQVIPGVFSVWLRWWGAEVGANVYWVPQIEIADRGLLKIGNNVVFGYQVRLFSHVVKPRKSDLMLYIKRIEIGNNVFIGVGSNLGPGVVLEDNVFVQAKTDLYPNQRVTADATTD
jgi:acetyltransferase-like isoleucine patch superfamily enzyme